MQLENNQKINNDDTYAKVVIRIKPKSADPNGGNSGYPSKKQITAFDEKSITTNRGTFTYPSKVFLPDTSQESLYEDLMPPLITSFLSGNDVNLLALGQTGSGKTHTIFGPPQSMLKLKNSKTTNILPNHGLLLRTLMEVYNQSIEENNKGESSCILTGSMVELNWDQPLDLLNNKQLCSIDDKNQLVGATQIILNSPNDIIELLVAVESRLTNGTLMNDNSSRSHCVTFITKTTLKNDKLTINKFNIVDMMGSERAAGQNSATDITKNIKMTEIGMQGIYSNCCLLG